MLSAFIPSELSFSAMPLVRQLMYHRFVQPGPLVLGPTPFKYPAPATDKDRTVSRRSEPSSRTTLMGEQETFGRLRYSLGGDRPSQTARLTLSPSQFMTTG